MALHDHRTRSESACSFYVFEDLRYQQNGNPGPVVYRYDDLASALNKYREIRANMTPALGMHLSEMSELDLVHRREGEHVLVTDYLNLSNWRSNDAVLSAVASCCEQLGINWQMDSKCMGSTILIPLERGFERIPDPCFADKQLLPRHPTLWGEEPSPHTAITEAYVPGEGWVAYDELRKRVDEFGWKSPHCVKVEHFNITYTDAQGRTGQTDMSPMDLQILQERYQLQHGDAYTVKRYIDRLCEEISELVVSPGIARTQFAERLKQDLIQGKTAAAREALETMRDYGDTDHEIAAAQRLLARVKSVPSHRPLEQQIGSAQHRKAANHTTSEEHEQSAPRR